jgi:hypothetical protein
MRSLACELGGSPSAGVTRVGKPRGGERLVGCPAATGQGRTRLGGGTARHLDCPSGIGRRPARLAATADRADHVGAARRSTWRGSWRRRSGIGPCGRMIRAARRGAGERLGHASRPTRRVLAFCLVSGRFPTDASVAELADALGLGPSGFTPLGVRVPPLAPCTTVLPTHAPARGNRSVRSLVRRLPWTSLKASASPDRGAT